MVGTVSEDNDPSGHWHHLTRIFLELSHTHIHTHAYSTSLAGSNYHKYVTTA